MGHPVKTRGRKIEVWLLELEKEVKAAVKEAILHALRNFPKTFSELIENNCGQAAVTAFDIIFTRDVEKAIEKGNKGLKDYWETLK